MTDLRPPRDPWSTDSWSVMPDAPPQAPPTGPPVAPAVPPTAAPWGAVDGWGAPAPVPTWAPAAPDPRRWGTGDIFWGLGIVLVASTLLTIPVVITGAAANGLWVTVLGALGTWAGFAGWPLYCSWVKGIGTLKADFGFRMEWYDLLLGLGAAAAALLVNVILGIVEMQLDVRPETNTQVLSDNAGTSLGVVLVSAIAVLGAPIFEELFFRGLTFGAIEKRWNRWAGFVVSTVLFTLLHAQPASSGLGLVLMLVHIGVLGVTFGLLRLFTGRLGPSIVAHMAVNGFATIVVLAGAVGG